MKNHTPDLGQDGRGRQSEVQSATLNKRRVVLLALAGILVRVSSGHGIGRHQAHLLCHAQRDNHPV